jgi:hypothetical protein
VAIGVRPNDSEGSRIVICEDCDSADAVLFDLLPSDVVRFLTL